MDDKSNPAEHLRHAQNALDRMRWAHENATGCTLTANMIRELSLTILGEIWNAERPPSPSSGEG